MEPRVEQVTRLHAQVTVSFDIVSLLPQRSPSPWRNTTANRHWWLRPDLKGVWRRVLGHVTLRDTGYLWFSNCSISGMLDTLFTWVISISIYRLRN